VKKEVNIKYKAYLVAYKNLDENVVEIITRYSVYHVEELKDLDILNEFAASGRNFSLNDRIEVYLQNFKEKVEEKVKEGYSLDVIELPKSYGSSREEMLIEFDIQFGDDILVVDTMEL